MAHFRTEFHGRGELADRQQKVGSHMAMLKKLAEEFNLAVVVTNQVGTGTRGGGGAQWDTVTPCTHPACR